MPQVTPFRGWRFDDRSIPLGTAFCPPHDAVSPQEATRLRAQPFNAANLEMPSGKGTDLWRNAVKLWKEWTAQGVLRQELRPSFYVWEETFRFKGRPYRRRGFLAALAVKDQRIRPARIPSKPKAERLALLRRLRALLGDDDA